MSRSLSPKGRVASHRFIVGGIVVLVCLVSLPRLASYVVHTNQADARVALEAFASTQGFQSGVGLPTWIASHSGLRHRLRDARMVERSGHLLHHGYVFAATTLNAGTQPGSGLPCFLAWPREPGHSGHAVYLQHPSKGLLEHPGLTVEWPQLGTVLLEGGPLPWERLLESPGWQVLE